MLQNSAIKARRCNTLPHTATRSTLANSATHCNTLQHTVTHCNTLPHTATHCDMLPHTATHCQTLPNTATHCHTLPITATHRHILLSLSSRKQRRREYVDNNNFRRIKSENIHWKVQYHCLVHTAIYCRILQHTATN